METLIMVLSKGNKVAWISQRVNYWIIKIFPKKNPCKDGVFVTCGSWGKL